MRTEDVDESVEPTPDDKIFRAEPVEAPLMVPREEVLDLHDRRPRKG